MIDTGAAVSLMRTEVVPSTASIQKATVHIRSATGYRAPVHNKAVVVFELKNVPGASLNHEFLVVQNLDYDAILGMDFLQRYEFIISAATRTVTSHHPLMDAVIEQQTNTNLNQDLAVTSTIQEFKQRYPLPFQDEVGEALNIEHSIPLSTSDPVAQPPYRVPIHLKGKVQEEISRLEDAGIIRKSTSAYASPAFIIPKKTGEIRLVCDYRRLKHSQYWNGTLSLDWTTC